MTDADLPAESVVESLIADARDATASAYVPYSDYRVGAALHTPEGETFIGCNVENANYSNSLHAEEVAVGEAVKRGHTAFDALAVVSAAEDGVTPCGMCRQTLIEFCDETLPIVCVADGNRTVYALGELLPEAISAETLDAAD